MFAPSGLAGLDTSAGPRAGPAAGPGVATALAFDACHVGVVLRAVLFVHAVLAVGTAFGAADSASWLLRFAVAASIGLPAVLLWLVLACVFKRVLARLPVAGQWAAAIVLGAVCGLYGGWLSQRMGLQAPGAFWPQVWPLVAAGAGFATALFYAMRLRASSQLPAATAARLAELQSRIRPHFLFNTLNTAVALVRVDPARAEAVLEDLAELFRVALQETGSQVSLVEEVELARRYLDIEQVRFGSRLQVQWDLDTRAMQARVPPLLLQPLVENAVKHGVEPSASGGKVLVRVSRQGTQAVIVIANTLPEPGSGHPAKPGSGMALKNTGARLRLLHDVAATFEAGVRDRHYRVKIIIPV